MSIWIRDLEPRTRLVEVWWVVDKHPVSFDNEEAARAYQQKNGGKLQVARIWETSVGHVIEVPTEAAESKEAT